MDLAPAAEDLPSWAVRGVPAMEKWGALAMGGSHVCFRCTALLSFPPLPLIVDHREMHCQRDARDVNCSLNYGIYQITESCVLKSTLCLSKTTGCSSIFNAMLLLLPYCACLLRWPHCHTRFILYFLWCWCIKFTWLGWIKLAWAIVIVSSRRQGRGGPRSALSCSLHR